MHPVEWHRAARSGLAHEMREALDRTPELIDRRDEQGQTALMNAALAGHRAAVELLVDRGAELDHRAKYGLTALMLAIVNQHEEIARVLLASGADTLAEGTGAPGFRDQTAADLARSRCRAELADAILLDVIERAFASVSPPREMSDSRQLSDVEYAEVMSFDGLAWPQIGFEQIERNADAVFWFSPPAFHYYLPGLLAAGVRAERTDTNAYDALMGMLDRSPEPEYWDDFFAPRFTRFDRAQLRAVASWIGWLESHAGDGFGPDTVERARITIELLIEARDGR